MQSRPGRGGYAAGLGADETIRPRSVREVPWNGTLVFPLAGSCPLSEVDGDTPAADTPVFDDEDLTDLPAPPPENPGMPPDNTPKPAVCPPWPSTSRVSPSGATTVEEVRGGVLRGEVCSSQCQDLAAYWSGPGCLVQLRSHGAQRVHG